jgi:hypothetical protein
MGCSASKNANTVIDKRYDEHGNLAINQSRSGGGLSMKRSSSMNQPGKIDVKTISTEQLLYGSKQININKPERLYLLLEKALYQQRRPMTPGGMADIDMLDDLTTERQTLYKAVIEQISKQEQQQQQSSTTNNNEKLSSLTTGTGTGTGAPARFIHPITKQTPLHLACRLVDIDQNCVSAKELCRVMDALLRTYPHALTKQDSKGHVPLHYAVAPNHDSCSTDHVNAKKTTTTDGHIVVTKKSSSNNEENNNKEQRQHNENENENGDGDGDDEDDDLNRDDEDWRARGIFVQHLFHSNLKAANEYWQQSDVIYDEGSSSNESSNESSHSHNHNQKQQRKPQLYNDDGSRYNSDSNLNLITGGCSPLYRVLQTIPDDFDRSGPTVDYIRVLLQASYCHDDDEEEEEEDDVKNNNNNNNNMAGIGNSSDGDKPLGLLYRRFTRQFDISEMFFPGDNSRKEVVRHREKYKYAAGNTWKIIEALLKPPAQHVQDSLELSPSSTNSKMHHQQQQSQQTDWGIVHRAVQMETPPDLLRYIVETNAQDLTKIDSDGNLPLHYAAMVKPPKDTTSTTSKPNTTHFPSFYSKYVVDELLYKFPEAAGMTNSNGSFPLSLAVTSGKQWIGGGIKSLYDAYPKALGQIDLKQKHNQTLRQALSMGGDLEEGDDDDDDLELEENGEVDAEEKKTSEEDLLKHVTSNDNNLATNDGGIIKDEHHDAIMLVQQSNVDFREVATAMWAHEEDAGVQMLGCCAIVRLLGGDDKNSNNDDHDEPVNVVTHTTLRMALTATASVVNAMKAHPNEMIVQEKACAALQLLAPADGRREVSMVASGAVASVVAAMQAHVGDASVQEEACAAIGAIVKHGGGDRATVVASVSGVTAILNAIAAHPRDVKVQKQGLNALWQLTNFNELDASMPELPRAQTEPLLAQAKESYPSECTALVDKLIDRMKE